MKYTTVRESRLDTTKKFVFSVKNQEVEFSYIHKNDGKDIIVCPTQTSCKMGCTFCFLTGMDLPVVNLTAEDIATGVQAVVEKAGLPESPELLLSFMGAGEPLLNYKHVINGCKKVCQTAQSHVGYKTLRFAIATMIPSSALMRGFTEASKLFNFKVHLSLHSPFDDVRRKMMPQAVLVKESLELLREHKAYTGHDIEIHYTLIDGFNDRDEDLEKLLKLLDADTPIKFLDFKAKPGTTMRKSSRVDEFRDALENAGIITEFYNPPGSDIGSSCGQFERKVIPLAKTAVS
jgi:23S rRNA (adenine2503-C2)-methyltransferase